MATWPPRTDVPLIDWWRCAIVILYNAGPRRSDLLALTPANVDFEQRELHFTTRKTRRKQVVPINQTVIAHIERIWSESRERLFQRRGTALKQFYLQWHKLQDAAGITPHFGPHSIRKTCATKYGEVADNDVASYIIGDSVQGVVAQYYINPTARIRKAVDELPQPEAFLSIFDSPSPPSNGSASPGCLRTDWQFRFKSASYRGVEFELGVRPLALLRALVAASQPLSFDELKTLFWNAPDISKTTIKRTIQQLRQALCDALNLPDGWDPVPHTSLYLDNRVAPENGQDGYTLWLP